MSACCIGNRFVVNTRIFKILTIIFPQKLDKKYFFKKNSGEYSGKL